MTKMLEQSQTKIIEFQSDNSKIEAYSIFLNEGLQRFLANQ